MLRAAGHRKDEIWIKEFNSNKVIQFCGLKKGPFQFPHIFQYCVGFLKQINFRSTCAESEFRSWFQVSTVATSSYASCSWKMCPKGISRRPNLARQCCAKMMYAWYACECLGCISRVDFFQISSSHKMCAERGAATLWMCCVELVLSSTESLIKELRKNNK